MTAAAVHKPTHFFRTMAVCFAAQNLAMGLGYGSFGPLITTNQAYFGIGRSAAAAGMSIEILAMGMLSPLAGAFLPRLPARTWMAIGCIASTLGYAGVAVSSDFYLALAAYWLIGVGISLTAILGPIVLVARWSRGARGRLLSIINLPLVLFAAPYLIATILPATGRTNVLLGMSALFLALLPLLALIREHPESALADKKPNPGLPSGREMRGLLRSPLFWLATIGIGLVAGVGGTLVVHLVPFGIDHGWSLQHASLLLSIYAAAGVPGTLLLGWLCDRIGPLTTLIVTAATNAVLCCALVTLPSAYFYGIVAVMGLFIVGLLTVHSATMSALFGPELAGRAVGIGYGIKLPFLFGFPPLAGLIFERTGGYRISVLLCAAILLVAMALFLSVLLRMRARQGSTVIPPGIVPS
jgi:cyanate permease